MVASNTPLILNSNNQITLSTDSFSSNIILVKAGSTFDIRKNVDGWYIQRNPAEGIIITRYKAKKTLIKTNYIVTNSVQNINCWTTTSDAVLSSQNLL